MPLAEAIRLLRSKLGESQEGMARRLGCSTSGYAKWERGIVAPRGEVMIKMLEMCPDEESRAAFGSSAIGKAGHTKAPAFLAQMKTIGYGAEVETELLDNAYSAKKILDELLESARAGDQNARLRLRDARDRLSSAMTISQQTGVVNRIMGEPPRPTEKRAVEKGKTKKRSARVRARVASKTDG